MSPQPLTVLIPTFNCEQHLRACLESVKWADELLICDSFSTDSTLAIVREYTDRIIQHEYINSAKQKNWAIPQASHEWVLIVDSDEVLDEALQTEIQTLLQNMPADYDGFRIPRKNLIFGKWLKSSRLYPDYNIRLFRRDRASYQTKEVHADILVTGQIGVLQNHLIHHDLEDIEATMQKWGRYIRYEGDEMQKKGRSYAWFNPIFRPLIVFIYFYFVTGGWREGFRGYFMAVMWSMYVFLKHARVWQLEWEASESGQQYWEMDMYDLT